MKLQFLFLCLIGLGMLIASIVMQGVAVWVTPLLALPLLMVPAMRHAQAKPWPGGRKVAWAALIGLAAVAMLHSLAWWVVYFSAGMLPLKKLLPDYDVRSGYAIVAFFAGVPIGLLGMCLLMVAWWVADSANKPGPKPKAPSA